MRRALHVGSLRQALFLLPFLCMGSCALAQDNLPVEYLGIEQGLSNNAVTCIHQDDYGFMWFGTYDGLNRYDGYNFKVFKNKPTDSTSLANNRIVVIKGDQDKRVWVGTKYGLSLFDHVTSTFSPIYYQRWQQPGKQKLTIAVNDIETLSNGDVFIATGGVGLLHYRKGTTTAMQVPLKRDGSTLDSFHAQSVTFDEKHDRVWVFVQGHGICQYDEQLNELHLVSDVVNTCNILLPDNNGNIWVGSEHFGLMKYNTNDHQIRYYNTRSHHLTNNNVVDLCLDKDNNLWIATDGGGVNIMDLDTEEMRYLLHCRDKNSLTSGAVYAIYEDNASRKWIGTLRGGINIIDVQKNKFTSISHEPQNSESLVSNFILSLCEGNNETLWIGTDGEGLIHWDRQQNRYTNFAHNESDTRSLSNNNVTRVIRDHRNNIWIATYGGGINRYNEKEHTFKHYACFNTDYNYENRNVWALYEAADKTLWAATCTGGGLYYLNREADRFDLFDVNVTGIITLAEDRVGSLWAGTFSQLVKLDRQRKKHETFHMNYPVRAICEDSKGNFWIGTEGGGLLKFDRREKKITASYTEEEGLSSNSVLNILEDKNGYLWISTFNGMSRFCTKNHTFKNFYESDGLQSNQFNYNAALKLGTGEFVFGGIKGFNIFYPDSIRSNSTYPKLLVTGISIGNEPIEKTTIQGHDKKSVYATQTITLPYDKAMISVDFTALEYSAPDKIQYAYYLQGWDNDWNYAGKVRKANYSRLMEGDYWLRIKSTNADGVWNPEQKKIRIIVLPPWYRTWWAYCIYGSLVVLAGVGYAAYQRNQARMKYEIKLAVFRAEKEKEMNEKKLSFFTNISHEFRTPLTLIINPVKELLYRKNKQVDTGDFDIIYRNARRLLSLMDQLLLFRKAESEEDHLKLVKLNLPALCHEVFLCFSHQAKSKNIRYEFVCDHDTVEIYADREKVEIALFNLIANALKFTPQGGSVNVHVMESDDDVEVSIMDSGCGIPEEKQGRLFDKFYQGIGGSKGGFGIGLYLVKKFMDAHKGAVICESKPDKGTTFTLRLLKGKDHLDEAFIFENIEERSIFLSELIEDEVDVTEEQSTAEEVLEELVSERKTMLVVDDNAPIRHYIAQTFKTFHIYEAESAEDALRIIHEHVPDIIISDVVMKGMSGVEFCSQVKENPSFNHIPVILLTASSSTEVKLKGIEGGADDYITKPFDKDLLVARVASLLKSRTNLQKYFYNEVTLQTNSLKVSEEYKEFLSRCNMIIEDHLDDPEFNIASFAAEMGMSHSNLYKKIKSISGRSVNEFMRFIRLRKAAELLINTDCNVNEAAFKVGFNDIKYFREQFTKLFEMKPSEYIQKFRKPFHKNYTLNEKVVKPPEG